MNNWTHAFYKKKKEFLFRRLDAHVNNLDDSSAAILSTSETKIEK